MKLSIRLSENYDTKAAVEVEIPVKWEEVSEKKNSLVHFFTSHLEDIEGTITNHKGDKNED